MRAEQRAFCSLKQRSGNLQKIHDAYTGLHGGLEHLKIETKLIDERFASVMGECVM